MENSKLESNQAYPIKYSRVWRECFNCGGRGWIRDDDGGRLCPDCQGEQGRWVEEKK